MALDSIPAAVRVSLRESSVLSNVFLPVLRVVADAWLQTAQARSSSTGLTWLVFEPVPMRTYGGDTVLARSPVELPLPSLQRLLVRLAFPLQTQAHARRRP